jgi:hypothetical protein
MALREFRTQMPLIGSRLGFFPELRSGTLVTARDSARLEPGKTRYLPHKRAGKLAMEMDSLYHVPRQFHECGREQRTETSIAAEVSGSAMICKWISFPKAKIFQAVRLSHLLYQTLRDSIVPFSPLCEHIFSHENPRETPLQPEDGRSHSI